MSNGMNSANGKTSKLPVILYIAAAVLGALFIYMFIAAITYINSYVSSYGMSFGDMWQEAIQYIVNNSLSYLIYGLLLFAAGKTLDVVQKSKAAPAPVVEAPAAASVKVNVFEEDPELTVQVNAEEDEATEIVTSKVPPLFR